MGSPINHLQKQISFAFENPNGSALDGLKAAVTSGLLDPGINLVQDGEMHTPYISRVSALEPATILVHVQYLQMLWAFTYAWFVIYEEGIQSPWKNDAFKGVIDYSKPLLYRAGQLLTWIETDGQEWPKNLPSPTFGATDEEKLFLEKTNSIFIGSVAFLLHHEFAHVVQGHFDVVKSIKDEEYKILLEQGHLDIVKSIKDDTDRKLLEREADEFAFSALILQSDDEKRRRSKGWSVLAPFLCELYLTRTHGRLFSKTHPFVHHRVDEVLQRLNFQDAGSQDYFTYLCSTIAKITLEKFGCTEGQRTFDTTGEALRTYLDDLDAFNR
jgi:hypothetical protein